MAVKGYTESPFCSCNISLLEASWLRSLWTHWSPFWYLPLLKWGTASNLLCWRRVYYTLCACNTMDLMVQHQQNSEPPLHPSPLICVNYLLLSDTAHGTGMVLTSLSPGSSFGLVTGDSQLSKPSALPVVLAKRTRATQAATAQLRSPSQVHTGPSFRTTFPQLELPRLEIL